MSVAEKLQMEKILDQRIGKKTRRKIYFEYLVKTKLLSKSREKK